MMVRRSHYACMIRYALILKFFVSLCDAVLKGGVFAIFPLSFKTKNIVLSFKIRQEFLNIVSIWINLLIPIQSSFFVKWHVFVLAINFHQNMATTYFFLFDSTQSQKVSIGLTHDSQLLYKNWFKSAHDSKWISEIRFKSTHDSKSFQNILIEINYDPKTFIILIQIDSWLKKTICDIDTHQFMTQWF